MSLSSGTRLGPYEIVAAIGAGGMGEVYRARDTRLERTVAVKVLPAHLSASAETRQRFEREAKTISSLSHPHICALYDVGNQDGVEYLVMEYLEGETLSDRLVKGPLAFEAVLRYGCEIADALDKAHRQGIVHRDLKPGNVMLTKSGVKLLDFGLAKAIAPSATRSGASLTALPTQTGKDLTAEGTILGTFQYMAPEQLEGRDADARSDIFAFGAVLYEMATGKKAFSGRSQASLISSIMTAEPPAASTLAPATPPTFDRVVRTCLAKDPDDRWQTAHDIRVQLNWIQEGGPAAPVTIVEPRRASAWRILPWIVAALATAGLVAQLVRDWRRPSAPPRAVRLSVLPPDKTIFTPPGEFASSQFALSPDGRSLAFVAAAAGSRPLLWVRPLDSLSAVALAGTEDAAHPFWSPDGRSLGFFTQTAMKRVEASGGAPQKLCDTAGGGRGGAWSPEGVIVFSDTAATPLLRVPDTGGNPEPATRLDASRGQMSHRYPSFLPDGRRFLLFARGSRRDHQGIYVGSLGSLDTRFVLKSESLGFYAPPGYLLTVQQGMLVAHEFDEKNARAGDRPLRVAEAVPSGAPPGYAPIAASTNGLLAFASTYHHGRELVWLDRAGRRLGTVGAAGDYSTPDLSPDERRVAVSRREGSKPDTDVWLFDSGRAAWSRFTFDPTNDRAPLWSPDGSRILYASASRGVLDLYEKPAGGAGEGRLVLATSVDKFPTDWSRDDRFLVYHTFGGSGAWDLWVAPTRGGKPFPFLESRFTEVQGTISPDGRWMAYASDESGRFETYVTEFPQKRGRWQISTNGGMQPSWRADGRELFYVGPDQTFMSVEVGGSAELEAAPPVALFKASFPPFVPAFWRYYASSADGQRFLVAALLPEAGASPINVVLNWTAGLKK